MSFNLSDSLDTVVSAGNVAASLPSYRNAIINGDMSVWQRFNSTVNLTSTGIYVADRWVHFNNNTTAGGIAISQSTDTPSDSFQSSMLLTNNNGNQTSLASNTWLTLTHKLEGYSLQKFLGQTFTFSFWVKSSKTGIYTVGFNNNTSSSISSFNTDFPRS